MSRLATLTLALLLSASLACAHYPVNPSLVRWQPDRPPLHSPHERRDDPFTPVVFRSYAGRCGFVPPAWIEETLRDRGTSRRRLRQADLLRSSPLLREALEQIVELPD